MCKTITSNVPTGGGTGKTYSRVSQGRKQYLYRARGEEEALRKKPPEREKASHPKSTQRKEPSPRRYVPTGTTDARPNGGLLWGYCRHRTIDLLAWGCCGRNHGFFFSLPPMDVGEETFQTGWGVHSLTTAANTSRGACTANLAHRFASLRRDWSTLVRHTQVRFWPDSHVTGGGDFERLRPRKKRHTHTRPSKNQTNTK